MTYQICGYFSFYDKIGLSVCDEDHRGAQEAVVVAGHAVIVGARGLHGEEVTGLWGGDLRVPDENIGLAVLPGDGDGGVGGWSA